MAKPKNPPKNPPSKPSVEAGARHAVDYTVRKATGQKSTGADRFRSREKRVTGEGKAVYRRSENWSPYFANPNTGNPGRKGVEQREKYLSGNAKKKK